MRKFTEQNELIRFASEFVTTRVESLKKDTALCLIEPYAPFPAILYCFSTIDLLGALCAGDASNRAPTSRQSSDYMRRFMHYTEEQSEMLMEIFRHKIVHLAQPKAVSKYNKKEVAWRYWHDNIEHHLKLIKLNEPAQLQLTSSWSITADHEFDLSIEHLVKDIVESVRSSGGYLNTLKIDTDLQDRFEKAILDIYG